MKRRFCLVGILSLLGMAHPYAAKADSTWSWTGTIISTNDVAGKAVFSVLADGLGWDLVIQVYNTAPAAPTTTAQILTGLYFDLSTQPGALTLASAFATGGTLTATNQTTPGANTGSSNTNICGPGHGNNAPNASCAATVAGGWEAAYNATGLTAASLNGGTVYGQHFAIGTSGQSGLFNGNATTGAGNANYGIAPVTFGSGSGGGIVGMLPYVYSSATFTLTGLASNQVVVSNVNGVYGTLPEATPAGQDITNQSTVPEPSTYATFAAGLLVLALGRKRFARG